jgi:mitochondrial splicing suppressor protein 51
MYPHLFQVRRERCSSSSSSRSLQVLTVRSSQALEAVFPDLGRRTELRIDLIGATGRELYAMMMFEEILHLLPSLKKLHCSFVGPEVPINTEVKGDKDVVRECCPNCIASKRTRSANVWSG